MAHRYGRLPTEILSQDVDEFAINSMILSMGMKFEAAAHSGKPMGLDSVDEDPEEVTRKIKNIFKAPKRGK